MTNLELLIGLVAIALAIFFGLWGFRRGIISELSTIKETVIKIQGTAEKTWDLVLRRFPESGGTVVRELENLGKVRITAEPGEKETSYLIEIEKPILREGFFIKGTKEPEFLKKEVGFFGKEANASVFSANRMRYYLPTTDPKTSTEFITFLLKWLNSTYVESLKGIKEFEEPILP